VPGSATGAGRARARRNGTRLSREPGELAAPADRRAVDFSEAPDDAAAASRRVDDHARRGGRRRASRRGSSERSPWFRHAIGSGSRRAVPVRPVRDALSRAA
jgi:hypothetical protein